jgi:hypothetical protein
MCRYQERFVLSYHCLPLLSNTLRELEDIVGSIIFIFNKRSIRIEGDYQTSCVHNECLLMFSFEINFVSESVESVKLYCVSILYNICIRITYQQT